MPKNVPVDYKTTSSQLALGLFEELAAENRSITEAPSDVGFRRNRLFLDITELGVSASRAIDAIHFLVSQDREIHHTYDFDLGFVKFLMNYNSNNHTNLKKVLREAQRATLEGDASVQDHEKWGSKTLLNTVVIDGGRLVVQLDSVVQHLIKQPEQSYFSSLRITNAFTSLYARRLYERLQDFVHVGTTGPVDLKTVKEWFGLSGQKLYRDYYEFNRGVLRVAVSQINEHSNLELEVKTKSRPGSKAVEKLIFNVKLNNEWQPKRESLAWTQELYVTLQVELGLSQTDFDEIRENRDVWTDDRIKQAIEYTRFMVQSGKNKVTNIPRYFMNALREQYRVPALAKDARQKPLLNENAYEKASAALKQQLIRTSNEAQERSSQDGLSAFQSLADSDKEALLAAFIKSPGGKLALKTTGVKPGDLTVETACNDPRISVALSGFCHQQLVPKIRSVKRHG